MLFTVTFCSSHAQSRRRTYCSPLDIDYKYSLEQVKEGISYRSGADPVIVLFKGEYYPFVTNSGGWWKSNDLAHWSFVTPSMWPMVASAHLAVSDIRVFEDGGGKLLATPSGVKVSRNTDERNAIVTWNPVKGAVGYNVCREISPGKLYQTCQAFNDHGTSLEIRALTAGQRYSFAVEAFNENGVSGLSATVSYR